MQKYFIVKASELKDGELKHFKYKGRNAILVNHNGNYRAFLDYCTHAGGPLTLEDGKLRCISHQALFDAETGCAEALPAPEGSSLMEIKIEVDGDSISHLNTIVFKPKAK
jgi:nitrite reductase/ring-hydroxylating ferredoxin subunit